jgi:SHS2 domain-containing protein
MTRKYELIDHTADFGIRVFGRDGPELFQNAAFAMFDMIAEMQTLTGRCRDSTRITGQDLSDLMVNWLRELLYLWSGREMLIRRTQIDSFPVNALSASLAYDPFDPDVHIIKNEIKAVTYHQIQVIPGPKGWEATVIFDV